MKTRVTICVDTYDSSGALIGSLMGARASSERHPPHVVLEQLTAALPSSWRQMSYEELVEHFATTRPGEPEPWAQLSIF